MHVGVEASRLARESRGIGRYVRALLPELAAADAALRVTCFAKDRDDAAALTAALAALPFLEGRCAVQPLSALGSVRTDLTWFPWNVVRPEAPSGPVVVTTHDIVPVAIGNTPLESWEIVGPVCESGDFLGRNRKLALQQGDLLAIRAAGAYGMSMSSNYNTRPRAAEVMVDGARFAVVTARERYADLVRLEQSDPVWRDT